ncbi:MAG TPA: peptidoglycan editing factor PgeF [Terriglobales bacterium]|nr:peptidoglycan editing factor PgeF [Terriglobales bacterium]
MISPLQSPLLAEIPWLEHGFGTRRDRPPEDAILLRQIHSDLAWRDPRSDTPGDAHFTRRRGRRLAVRTADCVPILMVDTRRRAVAAVHAGWRGTLARVAEKTLGEMRAAFSTDPDDVRVAIGPSIRSCCYNVGEEVQAAFRSRFAYADELFSAEEDDPVRNRYPAVFMTGAPPGHPYDPRWNRHQPARLDLAQANARQLEEAGIVHVAVNILDHCTACDRRRFYSHRRGDAGRMISTIAIVEKKV